MFTTPLGIWGLLAMLTVTPGEPHGNTVVSGIQKASTTYHYMSARVKRERERVN